MIRTTKKVICRDNNDDKKNDKNVSECRDSGIYDKDMSDKYCVRMSSFRINFLINLVSGRSLSIG